jgi:hypothetical protein
MGRGRGGAAVARGRMLRRMCEAVSRVAAMAFVLGIRIGILEICLGCCLEVFCFILLRIDIDRQTPYGDLRLRSNHPAM